MPSDAPDKWEVYKKYNRDVEVEVAIRNIVTQKCIPSRTWKGNCTLPTNINDRGVMVDEQLALNAIRFDGCTKGRLNAECQQITGLDNPNSPIAAEIVDRREDGQNNKPHKKKDYPKMMQDAGSV